MRLNPLHTQKPSSVQLVYTFHLLPNLGFSTQDEQGAKFDLTVADLSKIVVVENRVSPRWCFSFNENAISSTDMEKRSSMQAVPV